MEGQMFTKKKLPADRSHKDKRDPLAISFKTEVICHIILGIFALLCLAPFLLVVILSFTDGETIIKDRYSFFPSKTTLEAWKAVFCTKGFSFFSKHYIIHHIVSLLGAAASTMLACLYAYAISKKEFRFRRFFTWLCFIPMIFNAGLGPTYVFFKQVFGILGVNNAHGHVDSIIPLLFDSGSILILRTIFRQNISPDIYDAAEMDGCGEFGKIRNIVLPLAKPAISTMALLRFMEYWNEWFYTMLAHGRNNWNSILMECVRMGWRFTGPDGTMPQIKWVFIVLGMLPVLFVIPWYRIAIAKAMNPLNLRIKE